MRREPFAGRSWRYLEDLSLPYPLVSSLTRGVTSSAELTPNATLPGTKASDRHTAAILAFILISYFMILLDNSIIFAAIPKIQAGTGPASVRTFGNTHKLICVSAREAR
jgi:hypothetical protein